PPPPPHPQKYSPARAPPAPLSSPPPPRWGRRERGGGAVSGLSPDTWAAMQRKNLLIFLIASALFIGGLYILDKHVFPPPKKAQEEKEETQKPARPLPRKPGGLVVGGAAAGLVLEPIR